MSQLEMAGVATAVICTTAFTQAAEEQWGALGYSDGPIVAVGHPLGSMPPEQVLDEAEAAVERVIATITNREERANAASL